MLSKRLSIQWPPEEPIEDTVTMVVYSKQDHFVDIRVFKSNYPIINENPTIESFKKTFEWAMTGDEISLDATIPDTYVLKFTHEIDSLAIIKSIDQNLPLQQCLTDPDVGTFWKVPNSQDRKETGNMMNPATGKHQDYVEFWRSLSSTRSSPDVEVRELKEDVDNDPHLFVLRIENDQFQGQLIRTGNWCQGILYNKQSKEVPLNIVRAYFKGAQWEYLIKFGDRCEFPLDFSGSEGDEVESGGNIWKCIE